MFDSAFDRMFIAAAVMAAASLLGLVALALGAFI